jgi:hypothetical protein
LCEGGQNRTALAYYGLSLYFYRRSTSFPTRRKGNESEYDFDDCDGRSVSDGDGKLYGIMKSWNNDKKPK